MVYALEMLAFGCKATARTAGVQSVSAARPVGQLLEGRSAPSLRACNLSARPVVAASPAFSSGTPHKRSPQTAPARSRPAGSVKVRRPQPPAPPPAPCPTADKDEAIPRTEQRSGPRRLPSQPQLPQGLLLVPSLPKAEMSGSLVPVLLFAAALVPAGRTAVALEQRPISLTRNAKQSASLNCKILNPVSDYVHWYRSQEGRAPERLLVYSRSKSESVPDPGFSADKVRAYKGADDTCRLIVSDLQVSDSGVYHCASWDGPQRHARRSPPA
ncbi:nematocyst expressed protein 3-like [Monodelphis domestica]|uniref:nematocyst expressed protein 3-like n=1 Tax=Monodelphis domestica TaxID=13616 RepID=UPI0024E2218F|nr:nematocyst expressed protein 3-like [Monodelphis domestica]